jgi:hypothetical protein
MSPFAPVSSDILVWENRIHYVTDLMPPGTRPGTWPSALRARGVIGVSTAGEYWIRASLTRRAATAQCGHWPVLREARATSLCRIRAQAACNQCQASTSCQVSSPACSPGRGGRGPACRGTRRG